MEHLHDGHRQRLREQFLTEGLDGFDDVTVLELLLFYAVPRRDTRPLAEAVLKRFGSLAAVIEARPEDLRAVPGLGEGAAMLLALLPQLLKRYWQDSSRPENVLTTTAQCGKYLTPLYFLEREEVVYLLCLDAKCKVLDCTLVHRGSVNAASISVRKIVETALRCNATSVVLSHNHTSGIALPSKEDIATTERIRTALDAVGIQLADHIIAADDDFVSMLESGYMKG